MGREFELKFRATPEQLAAIGRDYDGFTEIRMETTYYDNEAGEFGRRHWTLRRRMENDVSVCTNKSDLVDGSRGEWEVCCDDIMQAIPQLIAMGAPAELAVLAENGVHPTCGARFLRRAVTVKAGSGTVEIALDQGVLLGSGKEEPLCEAEVELKSGTDTDAIAFASAFAAAYGLTREPKSKLARARALLT